MKRKTLLILVIISTLILCLITVFINSTSISSIDTWVYSKISNHILPNRTLIMRYITECGSQVAVIILCASLFLFPKTRRKWALPVTMTVVVTAILNVVLKLLFARERPDILQLIHEPDYSFPSGHAMNNMAFYIMNLFLTWKHVSNKKTKYIISGLCIILPLMIGFSRIYLGVHYASDVAAGWLLGFIVALVMFNIFEGWKKFNN